MARILVAEHNKMVSDYIYAALKKDGHGIETVYTSLDAWRACGKASYDVMIVDIVMPGLDSFVLAQRALQENPLIQIVFVTGFALVAMDTYATPAYAPAPLTMRPLHLKDVGSCVRGLLGHGFFSAQGTDALNGNQVIYADFANKTFEREDVRTHI
jgi:two-component system cell cycle response regulator CpdR